MTEKIATIMIPTHGRERLETGLIPAINSALDLAHDKTKIELILKFDTNDLEYVEDFKKVMRTDIDTTIIVTEQLGGYHSLHTYLNDMSKKAHGTWLLPFSDDSEFMTQGWDVLLERMKQKYTWVIWPRHDNPGGNLFPIVHRVLYRLQGHISTHNHVDLYWEFLHRKVPIFISMTGKEGQPDLFFHHERRFVPTFIDRKLYNERGFDRSDYAEMEKTADKILQFRKRNEQ